MSTIAVDVGGTSFKIAQIGPGGEVVRFDRVPHDSSPVDLARLADRLRTWVDGSTRAVGLAVPGVVDGGRLRSVRDKVGYLVDLDLVAWADAELGLPAVVENDARAACWGEFRSGAGRGVEDLLTVSLGTGVGVGAVVAGRLLRGAHGQGAILAGHVPAADGPACNCGARGCVEARASGWAARGAPEVTEEFLDAWALAVVGWCHVLDPARVVLTGGYAARARTWLPRLRDRVVARSWDPDRTPEFAVADDVWTSAARGVADLAREALA